MPNDPNYPQINPLDSSQSGVPANPDLTEQNVTGESDVNPVDPFDPTGAPAIPKQEIPQEGMPQGGVPPTVSQNPVLPEQAGENPPTVNPTGAPAIPKQEIPQEGMPQAQEGMPQGGVPPTVSQNLDLGEEARNLEKGLIPNPNLDVEPTSQIYTAPPSGATPPDGSVPNTEVPMVPSAEVGQGPPITPPGASQPPALPENPDLDPNNPAIQPGQPDQPDQLNGPNQLAA